MAKKREIKERESKGSFLNRYKLGSHHKMERFGIIVLVLTICLITVTGFGFKDYLDVNKQRTADVAVYSASAESSRTKAKVLVDGLWSNEKRTHSYLLFHFEDPTTQSLDVKDYMVFISASGEHLSKTPKASLFVFGTTGYMGVEFIRTEGLPNQVLSLIFRIKKGVVDEINTSEVDYIRGETDQSFLKYDQFELNINPAAKNAITSDKLNSFSIEPSDLYNMFVAGQKEKEIKYELQTSINKMRTSQQSFLAAKKKLESRDVVVPALPKEVNTDSFVLDEKLDAENMKKIEKLKAETDGTAEDASSDDSENPDINNSVLNNNKTLDYKMADIKPYVYSTDYVFGGGVEFNWHDKSLADGDSYIDDVLPPGTDLSETLRKLKIQTEAASGGAENDPYNVDVWKRSDGSAVDLTNEVVVQEGIPDMVSSLDNAYTEWYTEKQNYQRELLKKLLLLENESRLQNENFDVLFDDKSVVFWQQR